VVRVSPAAIGRSRTAIGRSPIAAALTCSILRFPVRSPYAYQRYGPEFGASCEYKRLTSGTKPPVNHANARPLGARRSAPHAVR